MTAFAEGTPGQETLAEVVPIQAELMHQEGKVQDEQGLDMYLGSALRVSFGGLQRVSDKVLDPFRRTRDKFRRFVDGLAPMEQERWHGGSHDE